MSARQLCVLPADLVALSVARSDGIMQEDAVESGRQQFFALVFVPLNHPDTVQYPGELVVDQQALPLALKVVRNVIVNQRYLVFVLGFERLGSDQRRVDQLFVAVAVNVGPSDVVRSGEFIDGYGLPRFAGITLMLKQPDKPSALGGTMLNAFSMASSGMPSPSMS